GVTAAALRFVPYLGTIIAMLMPASVAFLQSEGWTRTLATLGLFWIAALIAYVLDPIVNGSRTATAPFSLLLAAIFWTWLWGPVGLLLATPITLCLAAAGKHVPGMESLAILLAAEPASNNRLTRRKLRRGRTAHGLNAAGNR